MSLKTIFVHQQLPFSKYQVVGLGCLRGLPKALLDVIDCDNVCAPDSVVKGYLPFVRECNERWWKQMIIMILNIIVNVIIMMGLIGCDVLSQKILNLEKGRKGMELSHLLFLFFLFLPLSFSPSYFLYQSLLV